MIRFGAPLPLTGPLAPEGIKQQQGYDLWAEQANKAGGISVGGKKYKVEIVYADYQSNTPRAVQTTEQMITQDNVNFLFGAFGSGAAKAASTVSEKYKVPTIAAAASSSQVYDQGYKYLFGTFTPNDTLTTPLTQIIKAKAPDVKKVAILARNDLFPLAIAQEMEKSAKANGLEVVYFEKYAISTLDHSATLSQIKSLDPQWIFVTGYINDLLLVRKQMVDQEMKAPVVTMIAGPAYQDFIESAGQSAENITSASWWHPAERYDGKDIFGTTENFVKLFHDKYKSDPDYGQASAAVCGALFQMAIEKRRLARSRQGARRTGQARRHDVLGAGEIRPQRPDQFAGAAGIPDPGRQARGAVSGGDQAGRPEARRELSYRRNRRRARTCWLRRSSSMPWCWAASTRASRSAFRWCGACSTSST